MERFNFEERCYELLKKIPKRKVVSYKEIAGKLNSKAYRAVGNAMKKNKDKNIKCYKVVKSNEEIGGFNRGKKEKMRLLRKEGIKIKNNKIDLNKYGYEFG